jgi:rubrerythrin
MAERTTDVKTVRVAYVCDVCMKREMEFAGLVLTSYPPQYPHKCPGCGHVVNLRKQYPVIEYRDTPF